MLFLHFKSDVASEDVLDVEVKQSSLDVLVLLICKVNLKLLQRVAKGIRSANVFVLLGVHLLQKLPLLFIPGYDLVFVPQRLVLLLVQTFLGLEDLTLHLPLLEVLDVSLDVRLMSDQRFSLSKFIYKRLELRLDNDRLVA